MSVIFSRMPRKLFALGVVAVLAISAPVIRATMASASTDCAPAGASWQSSSQYATHSTEVSGLTANVRNNEWDSSGPQSVWAGSNGAFGACATQPGGVWPYPDEQLPVGTRLSRLATVDVGFPERVPNTGAWESAFDIWLGGGPGTPGVTEVMIWTDDHGQSTGNTPEGAITVDGTTYDLSVNGGVRRITLIMQQASTSGTVSILDVLRHLATDSRTNSLVTPDPLLAEVDWGWEISDTDGRPLSFETTSYTVNLADTAGSGCG